MRAVTHQERVMIAHVRYLQGLGSSQLANHLVNEINHGMCYVNMVSTLRISMLATLLFWVRISSWIVSRVCSKSSNWLTLMGSSILLSCSWIVLVKGRFTRILAGLEWNSTSWLGATSPCGLKYIMYTMRTNLLNWSDLVSIRKNVVFYAFGGVKFTNFWYIVTKY